MPLTFHLQPQEAKSLPSYSDKALLPSSILSKIVDTYDTLPRPLIFKAISPSLDNLTKTKTTYIGVREFTLDEDTIGLPRTIYDKLQISDDDEDDDTISIELMESIPKCTLLKLKPRYFYSEVPNWKFFLEDKLVKSYTILTEGEVLFIEHNGLRIELTVEKMNAKVCSIVDTDVVLEVVPLDNMTAAQQLEFNKQEEAEVEISSSSSIVVDNLKPLLGNVPEKARVFKLDITKFKGDNPIVVALHNLETSDDLFESLVNIDLVCGLDRFVGLEDFSYTTMKDDFDLQGKEDVKSKQIAVDLNSDLIKNKLAKKSNEDDTILDKYIYLVPFCWEKPTSVVLSIIQDNEDAKPSPGNNSSVDTKQCYNCMKYIAKSKFSLHEAFCLRNIKKCICGQTFLKEIPLTHWHCPHDDDTYGNGQLMRFKHERLDHHIYQCCGTQFKNFIEMVTTHKATVCQLKLHECKFCHLVLPQGETTYKDRFENLTNHENTCGNRTTECYLCNQVLRLKDLPKHLGMHELEKKEKVSLHKSNFLKCCNVNCMKLLDIHNLNELKLCGVCYGPLYMTQDDPTKIKLQGRIERRYVMQLSRGCGNLWCDNEYCLTAQKNGSIGKMTMKEKLEMVQNLLTNINVPVLPINKALHQQESCNTFWFCVSQTVLMKKVLIEMLISECEYDMEIIYKAANECSSNEEDIRMWLRLHGVRVKLTEDDHFLSGAKIT